MTTRVMIANLGGAPDKVVHVHVELRGPHGHFEQAYTLVLRDGEFRETTVHDGAQLAVNVAQAEREMPAPEASE